MNIPRVITFDIDDNLSVADMIVACLQTYNNMRTDYIVYAPNELDNIPVFEAHLSPANLRTFRNLPTVALIHCSDTRADRDYTPNQLRNDHFARGWNAAGYHFYIRKNGRIVQFRKLSEWGAHCKGHNDYTLGICYEGGRTVDGKCKDTMTKEQDRSMVALLKYLIRTYPEMMIMGHRDLNPDKACPCFDAKEKYGYLTNYCVEP